jgi:multidrug efflux pump subunit AcrA (membrane-fusion protein)
MPEANDPQLQQFLSSRGIYDAYYQVKSAESRLQKFIISAPFSGILSAANAEPGQTIGPQFQLGTLVDPDSYILQVSMNRDQIGLAKIGTEIMVWDQDNRDIWRARIDRVNPTVDPTSQMIYVYLKVNGKNLREGMYLEGLFKSDTEINSARIPKSALLRTGQVYIANTDKIELKPVQVLSVGKKYIRVSGLENGDRIVADAEIAYAGLILQ